MGKIQISTVLNCYKPSQSAEVPDAIWSGRAVSSCVVFVYCTQSECASSVFMSSSPFVFGRVIAPQKVLEYVLHRFELFSCCVDTDVSQEPWGDKKKMILACVEH